ncbi:MAG: 50S ribosomal protein L22 [Clostridia bacterium]|nr:50S ribosomal protein L22 [Clostridia bacterium]MDY2714675.1 50S ribosomal protein L22 [Christensenellaceae bacterium]MDY3725051.1 50S ribosomal protein L22 [Christensenellaceae bacterium]
MAKNTKLKTQRIEENKDKRPKAVAKYVRISPYKVRVVLDLIRGKSVTEAVAILDNVSKAGCEPIKKVVLSAAANAEHNLQMNAADLYVAACYADQGPTLKRMQPMSHGKGFRILKRTSHITVVLDARD